MIKNIEPNIRKLYDMKDVIYDINWFSKMNNVEIYYMYREVFDTEEDKIIMRSQNLRYDITVIPPRMLGCEYVKTQGHYHPMVSGYNISYPEVYEVLRGEGYFLMQKGLDKIEDVILVKADLHDKVIIPPNYGHITINPSDRTLETANWIANFDSLYDPIKKKAGVAYYMLKNGIIKNKNYSYVPNIRKIKPAEVQEIGIQKNICLYTLIEDINNLEFLVKPQKYSWLFDKFIV